MQVGSVYENRNGKYKVLDIKNNTAHIQYLEDGKLVGQSYGSVELLSRIHENIAGERAKEEAKLGASMTDYERMRDSLRVYGCIISVRCNEEGLERFNQRYKLYSGKEVEADQNEVFVCENYWNTPGLSIVFSCNVAVPDCYKSKLRRHATREHQLELPLTALAWKLIEDGFCIGINRMK